jgi:hypothetical protein
VALATCSARPAPRLPRDRAAAGDLEQALVHYQDIGDRAGGAEVLNVTGMLNRVSGEPAEAGACHQQALELTRAIGSTWDDAYALADLTGLARCAAAADHSTRAEALLRQEHVIFRRIGATSLPARRRYHLR